MGRNRQCAGQPEAEEELKSGATPVAPFPERRTVKKTRVVIRDNLAERTIELIGNLSKGDADFINRVGERIAQDTGWDVTVLAVEAKE